MLRFQDHRQHVLGMIEAALRAADPAEALRRHWPDDLRGGPFAQAPTLVVAMGKSSLEMARACLELRDRLAEQVVIAAVPERIAQAQLPDQKAAALTILPGDHPMPTERSVVAGRAILDAVRTFAQRHGSAGVVLALLSGGASAQTCVPAPGLTVHELRDVNRLLQGAGATIDELNCVRKHSEQAKGGLLGLAAGAATVRVFVASDVMGDAIDVIASGPFAPDPTTYAQALSVLEKYGIEQHAVRVWERLDAGARAALSETPKALRHARVHHTVISSNAMAREAAASKAQAMGFAVVENAVMNRALAASEQGEVLARRICEGSLPDRAAAIVIGGEPTVDTRAGEGTSDSGSQLKGLGGPSQELALAAALVLGEGQDAAERAAVGAFSTDGIDGPTDAAGAIITRRTVADGGGVASCRTALQRHDSHTFLGRAGALLRTGPTGVNVNHLAVALAYPP